MSMDETPSLGLLPSRFAHVFQPHKPQLCESSIEELFSFIWAQDPYNWDHPRYRLQTALAILLFYHLGIYPTVALSEGFYYRDTKLLATKQGDALRFLLLVCLRGRKTLFNSQKRWGGVTMVLADNPKNRRMCPVTLFLALAIRDGVVDAVSTIPDLYSVVTRSWPDWVQLQYSTGAGNIPVFRRTGPKSRAITTQAIKPSMLDKMLRALVKRAGHEATYATILDDNKRAAHIFRRERNRLSMESDIPPILIGRAQGELVFTLLASHLITPTNTPWAVPFLKADGMAAKNPLPLSEIIESQLRYDPTRLSIISHLYGICSSYTNITDSLWPFVEATEMVPYEPYYMDAEPDPYGGCRWCDKRLPRSGMKIHLLRCSGQNMIAVAKAECAEQLVDGPHNCKWGRCNMPFEEPLCGRVEEIARHISEHLLSRPSQCLWDGCGQVKKDIIELHVHLEVVHNVMSEMMIPLKAHFCFQCGIWMTSEFDWYLHAIDHARNPSIKCGPVTINGILAAPGRCLYCMKDGIYRQYENQVPYLEHVLRHIEAAEASIESLSCPHPACEPNEMQSGELREHLEEFHNICLSMLE